MGKVKKNRQREAGGPASHGRDLAGSIASVGELKDNSSKKSKERSRQEEVDVVDEKLTKKILESARQQQEELERLVESGTSLPLTKKTKLIGNTDSDNEDENEWPALESEGDGHLPPPAIEEDIVVDVEDEKILDTFMNPNPPTHRTLADIIMEKINEKQTDVSTMMPDTERTIPDMDPRILDTYRDVKKILQRYRSGKLPKAFKAIPHMRNWEEILYITEPETWSAAAMYQATRVFTSNMNAHMTQRFFYLVLLPRVRDDINYYKRLNFHLFSALKKTLFKPAAFFKGILLPLCEEGICTLREATIIGSVMGRVSIPVLHSSAAMLKIAEMNYSGANSIFLRILITKKYALPYRVIDALVFHFLNFRTEHRPLPVLWHQCLLSFAEIYRSDISSEQRESLLALLRVKSHEVITPEIRRQLQSAECRDVEMDEPIS